MMKYDVESHSHCGRSWPSSGCPNQDQGKVRLQLPNPETGSDPGVHLFPTGLPHSACYRHLSPAMGSTHLPVCEANDAPPKLFPWSQKELFKINSGPNLTTVFSAYNKSAQTITIIFCDSLNSKNYSLERGRLRGRVRPGDYNDWDQGDQGQRDHWMI